MMPSLLTLLESLQARAYAADHRPPPADPGWAPNHEMAVRQWFGPDATADSEVRRWVDQATREARAMPPTRFEEPASYGLLSGAAAQIEKVLTRLGLRVASRPVLGTMPTGRLEPLTVRPGDEDGVRAHLVLLEAEFVVFTLLLGRAVTDGRRSPSLFADLLLAYATTGRPGALATAPSGPRQSSVSPLAATMILFAVAHEYGHAVLGHLDEAPREIDVLPGLGAERLSWSTGHELDADVIGVRLAIEAAANDGLPIASVLCGADLLLVGIELMERTVAYLRTGDDSVLRLGSHSSVAPRRQVLRGVLPQLAPRDGAAVAGAISAAQQQESLVEELWQDCHPLIVRERAEGATAGGCWNRAKLEGSFTPDE